MPSCKTAFIEKAEMRKETTFVYAPPSFPFILYLFMFYLQLFVCSHYIINMQGDTVRLWLITCCCWGQEQQGRDSGGDISNLGLWRPFNCWENVKMNLIESSWKRQRKSITAEICEKETLVLQRRDQMQDWQDALLDCHPFPKNNQLWKGKWDRKICLGINSRLHLDVSWERRTGAFLEPFQKSVRLFASTVLCPQRRKLCPATLAL